MSIPYHSAFGIAHTRPALERRMVLIHNGHHHGANVEGFLAPGIGLVGEDFPDLRETVAAISGVGIGADVAIKGIGGHRSAGETLARGDVGVFIVAKQDVTGFINILCPVLRLTVKTHDTVVAADSFIVLSRDATGVVERTLSCEHHRGLRGHHENPAGVHEHGGFGVPVRLSTNIDAVDDQIYFATDLRELHDAAQNAGNPIHILDAALHGNLRASRDRKPLEGYALLFGQVQCCDDAPAFWFGEGAKVFTRISHQQDAGHAFGVPGGKVADETSDNVGFVLSVRTVDRDQPIVRIEIMLAEFARREFGPCVFGRGREHLDDFVGVGQSAFAHPQDLLVVLRQRFDRHHTAGGPEGDQQAGTGRSGDADNHIADFACVRIRNAGTKHNLFQSQTLGCRSQPVNDAMELIRLNPKGRPDVQQNAIPIEAITDGTARLIQADGRQSFREHALEVRQLHDAPGLIAFGC